MAKIWEMGNWWVGKCTPHRNVCTCILKNSKLFLYFVSGQSYNNVYFKS